MGGGSGPSVSCSVSAAYDMRLRRRGIAVILEETLLAFVGNELIRTSSKVRDQ